MVEIDGDATVDLDDEAREAARQQALAERADAEKRERQKVLVLNKLGAAAMSVRREFVKKLLARKTPPKTAATFVANCLARDSYLLTNHNGLDTTAELLGLDSAQAVAKLAADLPANGDGRAQVITLAFVLGALESRTPKDAWRNATPSGRHPRRQRRVPALARGQRLPLGFGRGSHHRGQRRRRRLRPVSFRCGKGVTRAGGVRASALAPPPHPASYVHAPNGGGAARRPDPPARAECCSAFWAFILTGTGLLRSRRRPPRCCGPAGLANFSPAAR